MTRVSALTIGLCLIVGVRVSAAQTATEEDFQAWRMVMEGRWVGQITWIADWPGLGKKGDKVTGYSSIAAAADGRALIGEFYGGDGTAKWITVYDAGAQQIRSLGMDSGGRTQACVISRQGGQWHSRCSGSLADGTKTEGDYTLNISDDGDTHEWRGATTVGGEAADALQDVFKRVGG